MTVTLLFLWLSGFFIGLHLTDGYYEGFEFLHGVFLALWAVTGIGHFVNAKAGR